MTVAVRFRDASGVERDGVARVLDGRIVLTAEPSWPGLARLNGVVIGGFTDAHVHLQLVDATRLAESTLGTVVDLGGDPAELSVRNSCNSGASPGSETGFATVLQELRTRARVRIAFAGAFLTPPGGYPSDRAWAPAGSVREIPDADAAAHAVADMKRAGAAVIKIASNRDAGPVFSDGLFAAIVRMASDAGLQVAAHAEGIGEAQRAARLGARILAHAPFSERLTDAEITEQAATVTWISTLAIHDGAAFDVAVDNVRRFHAAGGAVRYGTDMGNGETPVGLNPSEIAALREAGIDGDDLLRALAPADPLDPATRVLIVPGGAEHDADPLRARLLTPEDLTPEVIAPEATAPEIPAPQDLEA